MKLMRCRSACACEFRCAHVSALLRGEYEHFERDPKAFDTQLDCLSAFHGRQKIEQWKALARDDDWDRVVEQLLVEHYDPAYLKSIDRNFERAASAGVVYIESDAIEDYKAAARTLVRSSANLLAFA